MRDVFQTMKDNGKEFRNLCRMKTHYKHIQSSARLFAMNVAMFAIVLSVLSLSPVSGQTTNRPRSGGTALYESGAASGIVEKVRSGSQGVIAELLVKSGDAVKKGQILAHTELDSTKYQLDLAQHTFESKASVDAARDQAEAWTATRAETELGVRQHKVDRTHLDWALAMEKMYRAVYDQQLELKDSQQIQYAYWKDQYEKRFFRAPVDGVISDVLVDIGKPVNTGTHAFTIRNDGGYTLPVPAPALLADAAATQGSVPVRAADGKTVTRATVDGVTDDPLKTGWKIIRLLIQTSDFPASIRAKLNGMKFDVLLPQVAQQTVR